MAYSIQGRSEGQSTRSWDANIFPDMPACALRYEVVVIGGCGRVGLPLGIALRTERGPHGAPQRLPHQNLGHEGWHGGAPSAEGRSFPSLLEPRRRGRRRFLAAVITEAYVKGVSTRIDDLVRALGMDGISKSEVSRMCKALDAEVEAFLTRPIEGELPYVWLDATFHKVREGGRVIPMATVVAGWRQVLGIAAGPSEDHAFWTAFLRSLIRRGCGAWSW
jgi:hypothetical protein